MRINRNHEHAAIIIILKELYLNIDLSELSPNLFERYLNFEGLKEYDLIVLLNDVVDQLLDLDLISTGNNPIRQAARYSSPRLTGQGKILLDKVFENSSLQKFLYDDMSVQKNMSGLICDKVVDEGPAIFVDVMFAGLKKVYSEILGNIVN